jgi:hypothetical protein
MPSLWLLLALVITVLPAWVWLARLVPVGTTHRRLLVTGYALLLGMIGITVVMRLLSATGIPFSLTSIGSVAALILLMGLFAPQGWRTAAVQPAPAQAQLTRFQWVLVSLCLALLFSRLIALGVEVGTKPLFAWDAKQHWTKQAKVFYELGSIAPYVQFKEWLALGGQGVYTNVHPDYPITTSLLQTWVNVALGQWHDSLMNLPWILVWLAIGLIFYAQARIAGVERVTALAATYMVLSLPYLNTQIALAGYADVVLSLCFLAALGAFYNWSQHRDNWQAVLLMLCAASGLLIKNEGVFWLLSFAPGLVLVACGIRRGLVTLTALFAILVLVMVLMPENWVVAGQSLKQLSLHYRPAGWQPIYLSFLIHDNWHFFSYLLLAAILIFIWTLRKQSSILAPVAVVILSSFALYFFLYLFTRHSHGAVYFTSLNRVALQLMPAAAFFTLLAYSTLTQKDATLTPKNPPVTSENMPGDT